MQRDKVSQEITIFQAVLMKDKTSLAHYLQYWDRGFMYLMQALCLLLSVHEVVRRVVSDDPMKYRMFT